MDFAKFWHRLLPYAVFYDILSVPSIAAVQNDQLSFAAAKIIAVGLKKIRPVTKGGNVVICVVPRIVQVGPVRTQFFASPIVRQAD